MRRFRFTLEAVRRIREQAESSAQEALARELEAGRSMDSALVAAASRLASARRSAAAASGGIVAGGSLLAFSRFVERRELEASAATQEADDQQRRIEQQRRALADAARDRMAIERLKTRSQKAHALSEERAENRALDEIAVAAHARKEAA
jgi:flagellar protein FliJ